MAKVNEFDRFLEKLIRRRNWEDLAGFWLQDVPEIIPPGSAPEAPLEEVIGLVLPTEVAGGEPGSLIYSEVPGLRKALLRESIFLLHKTAHVVSAAELNAVRGQLTWSLSDGYHGALFGARAILGILGIGVLEVDSKTILFNVWPVRPEHEHRRRGPRIEHPRETAFLRISFKIEHRHIWAVFTRLLRTISVPGWPARSINKIKGMEGKSFSRQRNLIHYSCAWPNRDLHEWLPTENFGLKALAANLNPDEEDPEFSLAMGLFVLHLGRILLEGIETRLLDIERRLFDEKAAKGWHPLFSRAFPESASEPSL